MKTENWLQFQAVSCSPTGAKHNINGAGRILNRSQGFGARGSRRLLTLQSPDTRQELSKRQHTLPFSPVHVLPQGLQGDSEPLCSLMSPGFLHNSGVCVLGGVISTGAQCLHLVPSRVQGRVKSEFKEEKGLILK